MDLISLGRFTISLARHIIFRVCSLISLNLKSVLNTTRSVVYRPAVYCDACCFCIKKIHYWTALLNIYCNASHQWWSHTRNSQGESQWLLGFFGFFVFFLGGGLCVCVFFPLGQFTTSLYNYMPNSFFCITESWPKRISAQDTSLKLLYSELLLAAAIKIIRRHKCDRQQC